MMASDSSKEALAYAAHAVRLAGTLPDIGEDVAPRPILKVGIAGGGTMGSGIALACLAAGLPVVLAERDGEAARRARARILGDIDARLDKGRIDAMEADRRRALLAIETDLRALGTADLVIEAVFEDMETKCALFRAIDRIAKAGALLATNTSYLDIDRIAAVTARPEDVLGLHFFSPAHVMRLLEIIRARRTAPDALASALAFAQRIDKQPVIARVCHGFIGNRMLEGYVREAGLLLLEGASIEAVDAAIRAFGYRMGPFEMGDLAGLDIGHMLRAQFPAGRFDQNAYRVADRLVAMGRKGQKTGAGYYRYEPGSRRPIPDPAVEAIAHEERALAGMTAREIGAQEIVERCLLPLVNEGARILEEGIAMRGSDIDVVYLEGYGFPRGRGGPMYWADSLGLPHVLARIEAWCAQLGARWWTPAPLLARLAQEGGRLSDYCGF